MPTVTRCSLAILFALGTSPAMAAFVFVQWPQGGTLQLPYPQVAQVSGPGYSAVADLGAGRFAAHSWATGDNSLAYAGFTALTLRWEPADGISPLQLPHGWLTAIVTGAFSVAVPPESALGSNTGSSTTLLGVTTGGIAATARLDKITSFSPGGQNSLVQLQDQSSGGAQAVVSAHSASVLSAALLMPALTLAPNQFMTIGGLLQTNLVSVEGAVSVDFSNTYSLQLRLPADFDGALVNLVNGQAFAPEWVRIVPLPAAGWLFLSALALVVAPVRRFAALRLTG